MSTFDSIPDQAATGANVTVTNFPATQPVSSADGALNTIGAQADAAWSGSGSGTVVAILKKLVALLTGTVTVAFAAAQAVTQSGAPWRVNASSGDFADGAINTVGTQADAAWSGSGSGTVVAILKKIVAVLTGTLTVSGTVTAQIQGSATLGGSVARLASSAATTNATNVKGSAGTVYGLAIMNTNAAVRYLHIYDKATAPTVGTDTPIITIPVPVSNGAIAREFAAGVKCNNGIGYALTTDAAAGNNAVAAGDLVGLSLDYV